MYPVINMKVLCIKIHHHSHGHKSLVDMLKNSINKKSCMITVDHMCRLVNLDIFCLHAYNAYHFKTKNVEILQLKTISSYSALIDNKIHTKITYKSVPTPKPVVKP